MFRKVTIGSLANTEPGSFKIGPFGSSLKKEELVERGVAVAGIENVLPNKFVPQFRRFITEQKFRQLFQYEIKPNDILVTTMGTIGRAAVFPKSIQKCIIDSHLFRMRVDETRVNPNYLCYAINGFGDLQREISSMANGAIMAGLNTKILKMCSVPLPPMSIQEKIVSTLNEQLTAVEKARAAAEEQLETANAITAAYLRYTFRDLPLASKKIW